MATIDIRARKAAFGLLKQGFPLVKESAIVVEFIEDAAECAKYDESDTYAIYVLRAWTSEKARKSSPDEANVEVIGRNNGKRPAEKRA